MHRGLELERMLVFLIQGQGPQTLSAPNVRDGTSWRCPGPSKSFGLPRVEARRGAVHVRYTPHEGCAMHRLNMVIALCACAMFSLFFFFLFF